MHMQLKDMLKEKVDDYTKIDYSIPKLKEKDYEIWEEYFQALCNYINLKFKNTYGSKEN